MAEVPQHPVDCGLGAQSTEILLRYALGLNTSAPAHETLPSPPTNPPPTAASSPPAPPYCHIRVHGRKQQSSFDTWVASIQVTAGCKIAVVLDGSESFQMALKQLRRQHEKKNPQISMLHATLHDDVNIKLPSDGRPFILLTTEAFYKRDLRIKFDAVYDDCQVHRQAIEQGRTFGLMATLKTFVISTRELESRQQMARRNASKWGAFKPRTASVAGCVDGEPADLQARNAALCKDVKHPMIGFSLPKPKLLWRNGSWHYEPEHSRGDPLDVNALPLANLLFDAADAEAFAASQRLALVATVCASQITSNMPRIFESVARATFSSRAEKSSGGAVTSQEKKHAWEVALSVLVRAFLSGCGSSTEEIGLAILFLQRRMQVLDLRNFEGALLENYATDPVLLEQAGQIMHTLLYAMTNLIDTTLAGLGQWWGLTAAAKARIAAIRDIDAIREQTLDAPRAFLESAVRSAAKRGQLGCGSSVLDVGLVPMDTEAQLKGARDYFHQLKVGCFDATHLNEKQNLELEVVRQSVRRHELEDAWVEYQLVAKGERLTIKSKAAADYFDDFDDYDDDPFDFYDYGTMALVATAAAAGLGGRARGGSGCARRASRR